MIFHLPSSLKAFQSTLPARGSDILKFEDWCKEHEFQSTLPARGSDVAVSAYKKVLTSFQSTLPARGSDAEKRRMSNV